MQKLKYLGIVILLLLTGTAFAAQITVPQAPGKNYVLVSTTTGSYIAVATSTLGLNTGINFGFPFTAVSYGNATGTVIAFLGGLISNSSTTLNGTVRLPSLANGSVAVNSGTLYSSATTTAGTGLTSSGGAFNVNTTQNITNLSNLSSAGTVNTTASGGLYATGTSTPTVSAPFTYSGTLGQFIGGVSGAFACTSASSGVTGCLTGTDWNTFNSKQAAGNYITALTGDVTATGPNSVAATIAANAVTYAKLQTVAANSLIGNPTGATGAAQAVATSTLFQNASATASGLLTSTDYGTFQNKVSSSSLSGGTGIGYVPATGVISNTGVTSLTAGSGIAISAASGAVTLTNTIGYPFPGNATGTTLTFSNGFVSSASSTINASTTVTGQVTLTGATTTAAKGFNIQAGCYAINGTCLALTGGGGTGTGSVGTSSVEGATQVAVFSTNGATPALVGGNANFSWSSGTLFLNSTDTNENSILGRYNGGTVFNLGYDANKNGQALIADNLGNTNVTLAGAATSTFVYGLSADTFKASSTTASSTFANGVNLTKGCYALNGVCLSHANLTGVVPIANGGTNNTTLSNNGVAYFNGTSVTNDTSFTYNGSLVIGPTFESGTYHVLNGGQLQFSNGSDYNTYLSRTGNTLVVNGGGLQAVAASSTLGNGTQAGGLTVSGGATTTGNLVVQGAGTSTFANGTNIATGCYAIAGVCLSTSGGGSSFAYPFPGNATTTGLGLYASTTVGAGAQATGLTISGGATTTGNSYLAGKVGIGSTSPTKPLEVLGDSYITGSLGIGQKVTKNVDADLGIVNSVNGFAGMTISNPNTGSSARTVASLASDVASMSLVTRPSTAGNGSELFQNSATYMDVSAGTGGLYFIERANAPIVFNTGGFNFANERARISGTGELGLASSSPYARLSIQANSNDANVDTTLFAIGSSTATATSTLFAVSNTGSTTASNGFNISSGCYAVNGTCLSTTGGSASTTLLQSDSNTFSGLTKFTNTGTTTFAGPIAVQGWVMGTSTTVCRYPDSCQFQASATGADVAIQAAITWLKGAGGGTLIQKRGAYNWNAPVTVDFDGFTWQGEGNSATMNTAKNGFNDYMVKVGDAALRSNLKFKDVGFNGNKSNQTAGGCIMASSTARSTFDTLWLDSCFGDALKLAGTSVGGFGYNNAVINSYIANNTIGIEMVNNDENQVYGNTINSSSQYHIWDRQGLQNIHDNVFTGVIFNTGVAIYSYFTTNTQIHHNTFDSIPEQSIQILCNATQGQHKVDGNYFFRSSNANTGKPIIQVDGCTRNSFTNNYEDSSSLDTFGYQEVNNAPTATTFSGNTWYGVSGARSMIGSGNASTTSFFDYATTTPPSGIYWSQVDATGQLGFNTPTGYGSYFSVNGVKSLTLSPTGLGTLLGGLISQASSTIGNGTQAGGLTITGGGTTTGSASVLGVLNVGGTNGGTTGDVRATRIVSDSFSSLSTGAPSFGQSIHVSNNSQVSYFTGGDSNGNVLGVGTTSPGAALGVQGNGLFSGVLSAAFIVATGTATIGQTLTLKAPTSYDQGNINFATAAGAVQGRIAVPGNSDYWFHNNSTDASTDITLSTAYNNDQGASIKYTPGTSGAGNGVLQIGQLLKNAGTWTHGITELFTNGTERLRIDLNGNVGIGSTSPQKTLVVQASTTNATTTIVHGASKNPSCDQYFSPNGTAYRTYMSNAGSLVTEVGYCQ